MWIIQNDVLMELPNDVPLPPDSRKIEVPEELQTSPHDFKVQNGTLIKQPKGTPPSMPQFTVGEIEKLKSLLASGALATKTTEAPETERRSSGRRKEDK